MANRIGTILGRTAPFLALMAVWAQAKTYFWNRDTLFASAGGIAKSYNWSSKADGTGGRPPGVSDDGFDAGPLDTAWHFVDQHGTDSAGRSEVVGGKLVLSGQGLDFTQDKHYLAAATRSDIKGNFDVTVRVDSQVEAHAWSKAGIIMANDFSDYSKGGVALVALTPGNGAIFEWCNATPGNIDATIKQDGVRLKWPVWLRLAKAGTQISAYYRQDTLADWKQLGTQTATAGTQDTASQIGLFVTAVDSADRPTHTTQAWFDDFRGGGDISNPSLDYGFNGTARNADVDVVLASDFAAHSIDFTGYTGKLTFNSYTLTLGGSLKLVPGMQSIKPGTGSLVFNGSGQDTLWPRPNDTLPILRKAGSGRLSLGGSAEAVSLKMEAGILDLNNSSLLVDGLAATGGAIEGLGADDSLLVAGDADFSGLSAFNGMAGSVIIKSMGNGASSKFDPGGKTFPRVVLWTWATGTSDATVTVGPGALTASKGITFRNHGSSTGFDGTLDFKTRNPSVTVGGDLVQIQDGTGTNQQILHLGSGTWTCQGNVSLDLKGGGSGGAAAFRFTRASGTQSVLIANGAVGNVEHGAADTLKLNGPLSAASLRQSAGSFDFNGFDLALKGDLTVTKGGPQTLLNLQGRTLTVEGDARFAGTAAAQLGLNPSSVWTLKVSKQLTADSADIGKSDATGFATGIANEGCDDKGGNRNWTFWQPPAPPVVNREPTDLVAKPGWTVSFTAGAAGSDSLRWEWRRQGDTAVLARDSILMLASVKEAQSGGYYAIVSNAYGADTTRAAVLTVRSCDSLFSVPADVSVREGGPVTLAARTGCAAEVYWAPVSGPVPRLLDPQVETLAFIAPRVAGDSLLVLRFSARYGASWESGDVKVTVKDTIPDPVAALAPQTSWNGAAPRVIKAGLSNAAALAAFPEYPVRYLWSVVPDVADTSQGADSLVLRDPGEDGNLDVTVCADNGGAPSCARTVVSVERATAARERMPSHAGPLYREGDGLRWTRAGMARIVDWRGRILWRAWGGEGSWARPGSGAMRALATRSARLEFLAPKR